jgi:hypothetical protein
MVWALVIIEVLSIIAMLAVIAIVVRRGVNNKEDK